MVCLLLILQVTMHELYQTVKFTSNPYWLPIQDGSYFLSQLCIPFALRKPRRRTRRILIEHIRTTSDIQCLSSFERDTRTLSRDNLSRKFNVPPTSLFKTNSYASTAAICKHNWFVDKTEYKADFSSILWLVDQLN
jgi:hypothetical protein